MSLHDQELRLNESTLVVAHRRFEHWANVFPRALYTQR